MDELAHRDDQTLFELCARLATRHGLASTRQAISPELSKGAQPGIARAGRL